VKLELESYRSAASSPSNEAKKVEKKGTKKKKKTGKGASYEQEISVNRVLHQRLRAIEVAQNV